MAMEKFTAPLETMVDIVLFEFMGLKGIGPAKKRLDGKPLWISFLIGTKVMLVINSFNLMKKWKGIWQNEIVFG